MDSLIHISPHVNQNTGLDSLGALEITKLLKGFTDDRGMIVIATVYVCGGRRLVPGVLRSV